MKMGIILEINNPVLSTTIRQVLEGIKGINIIYITIRNNIKLYIVDEEEIKNISKKEYSIGKCNTPRTHHTLGDDHEN